MRKATNGICFDDVHSFDDLNLVLSKKDIPPAAPKTTYIDIPGADGSLDLSETHGEVKYKDRDCTFTFTMHPGDTTDWEEKKTEISNLLNGKVCKITLDTDEDYYYQGRCTVSKYLQDRKLKQFTVTAKVKPYKFKQEVTVVTVPIDGTEKAVNLNNGRKAVSPSIECTNDNTVISFGGATFNLSAGTHKLLDIQLKEGINTLTISGTGTVTFRYQEGDL
jgi:phage-related protein